MKRGGWRRKGGRRRVPTIPSAWHFRPALKEPQPSACLPRGRTRPPRQCGEASPMATYREITFPRLTPPTFLLVPVSRPPSTPRLAFYRREGARARVPAAGIRLGDKPPGASYPIFESFSPRSPRRFIYRVLSPIHRRGKRVSSCVCLFARLYLGLDTGILYLCRELIVIL